MSSSPGERELKTPRKLISEEPGGGCNSAEVHELCVFSPWALLFPKEGPQPYPPVYWEQSSVAAQSPSGGTGEGTKQASIRGKRCTTVISPGAAPVDKVDMGGAPSCPGRMGSEGTALLRRESAAQKNGGPRWEGITNPAILCSFHTPPPFPPSSSQLVLQPLPPVIQPDNPDQGLETGL